ncbi:hypothetical protein V5799_023733 [Amblyomma americanum]|uniref:Centrosomal protein of 78 kDa n=1 Tax=Amblyomma americanum TaxID=6943 RepID=A0AAQ4FH59_AMBAM
MHGKHPAQSATVPTFRTIYKEQCDNLYVCSRRALLSKIPDDASLDLYVDIIRADEWKPVLQALRLDRSLEAISFRSSFLSNYPELIADVGRLQLVQKMQQIIRVPPLFTPESLKAFCSALSEHLKNNARLRSLELIGFPFSLAHLQDLSLGIRASTFLASLSFDGSSLGRQSLEALCHALREKESVRQLSLCDCHLGSNEVELLAWLLQQQSLGRQGALWQGVLRQRTLALDSLRGLRRLSLCRNPLGDQGVCTLVEALADNFCLQALDLQCCNVGSSGARALLDLLDNNVVLEVIDIRQNPNVEGELAKNLAEKVASNRHGRHCEYDLLPLGKSQPVPEPPATHHQRSQSVGRPVEVKTTLGKWKRRSSSLGRVANSKTCKAGARSPSPDRSNKPCRPSREQLGRQALKRVEEDLRRCKENLRKEQEVRQAAERKLLELFEENRQLRSQQCKNCKQPGYSLVPDSLLKAIEKTFLKFHQFLAAEPTTRRNYTEVVQKAPEQSKEAVSRSSALGQLHQAPPKDTNIHAGSTDVPDSTKERVMDPGARTHMPSTYDSASMQATATSKPPVPLDTKLLQNFVQSKAKKIISEIKSRGTSMADPSLIGASFVAHNHSNGSYKKNSTPITSMKDPGASQVPRLSRELSDSLADLSPLESSKRLSEILGIDQVPSKLVQSKLGSAEFFPLESETGSTKYKSDFTSSTSMASAFSEAEKRGSVTKNYVPSSLASKPGKSQSQKRDSKSSTQTSKSSHNTTLVSSIQEELVSNSSVPSSYKRQPGASGAAQHATNNGMKKPFEAQQDHQLSLSDTISLSLSQMPSKSFDMDTADITVSSIHSLGKHRDNSKGSARDFSQRHSTPTLSHCAQQGMFDVVSTPSNVSLSLNQSEVSTPSTPDTMTPPQLAGSDFDGF